MLIYLQLLDDPGDKAAFGRLYSRYRGLMYREARRILQNCTDAEDAVHQAFISLIESGAGWESVSHPRTRSLVLLITRRRAIDLLRRRHPDVPLDEEHLAPAVPPLGGSDLADAMARLPAEAREILLLRYDNNCSVRELAKLLNISEAAVYKRLARAKVQLKERLEEEGVTV